MHIIKNIWFVWLAVILLLSCKNDGSESGGVDEQDIEFAFQAPITYATTPGTDAEKNIVEVDLLIFKDDKFLYRRVGWRVGNTFRATLKIDTGLTIYFITNCRTVIEDHPSLIEDDSWHNDIRPALIDSRHAALVGDKPLLPMWGMLGNVDVVPGTVISLGSITLLRSVASVNIEVLAPETNFSLDEAFVYFASDRGFLAPSSAKFDPLTVTVSGPESPTGANTTVKLHWDEPEYNSVIDKFYFYENDATDASIPAKRPTRVVVGGYYDSGSVKTYYPLDLWDGEKVLQATRNHKYLLSITKVNAPGWTTPDEASEAPSVNVEYNVVDWESDKDEDIIVDGSNWISVGRKYSWLSRFAGSTDQISFTTNIDPEKFTLSLAGGNTNSNAGSTENERFRTELVKESGEMAHLKITAFEAYNDSDEASNHETLTITSGRIRMTVYITQLNSDGTDWDFGGNDGIDLGDRP